MTNSTDNMDSSTTYSSNNQVLVRNGESLKISHIGDSHLSPSQDLLDVLVASHITKEIDLYQ